jgi:hypothetical protein
MAFESKILQNGFGRFYLDIIVRYQKEKFGKTFFIRDIVGDYPPKK